MEVSIQMIQDSPSEIKKELIVIQGPTASGKTGLAVGLAQALSSVIISADSRQFYREMSVGTAKPTTEEQEGITHYFIDSHNIEDEVTAARFAREADELLKALFVTHDRVILSGGSGMFVDALIKGIDNIPADPSVKSQLITEFESFGLEVLLKELKEKDPEMYVQIDRNNPSRVIRSLEAIRLTGKPYSEMRTGNSKEQPYKVHRFIIEHPREKLYERIEQRVDQMIASGLVDEVRSLLSYRDRTPLRTVGYTEVFQYLDNELSLEETIALIKQHTRNYAKRQLTWLRRYNDAHTLSYSDNETMVTEILRSLSL
jgi:tRNA dimethylallyltransferase